MIKNTLAKIIDKYQGTILDEARDYIGASSIGSDCLRQIWYQYKGFEVGSAPPQTRRTWDIGKKLESLVLKWLEDSGAKIESIPDEFYELSMPYFKGNIDGKIYFKGKLHILEIKTAKDSSFKIFDAKGLQIWNPQYYAQIQAYMGLSHMYDSAYILVLNKDNSLISDELVLFDEDYYLKLKEKAKMIHDAVIEPPRINGSALWWQCKMCKYNSVCHK